jgi:hypothetical protein
MIISTAHVRGGNSVAYFNPTQGGFQILGNVGNTALSATAISAKPAGEPALYQFNSWGGQAGDSVDRTTAFALRPATYTNPTGPLLSNVTLQSFTSNNYSTATANLVLTKPSGVATGDLLILLVGNDTNAAGPEYTSGSAPGFTLIQTVGDATSDAYVAAFYRIATGAEGATIGVTNVTAANQWGAYLRLTGAASTGTIPQTGATYSAITSNPQFAAITTTFNRSMVMFVASSDGSDTQPITFTGPSRPGDYEYYEQASAIDDTAEVGGFWGYKIQWTAGNVGNVEWLTSLADVTSTPISDGFVGFMFSIKPA